MAIKEVIVSDITGNELGNEGVIVKLHNSHGPGIELVHAKSGLMIWYTEGESCAFNIPELIARLKKLR